MEDLKNVDATTEETQETVTGTEETPEMEEKLFKQEDVNNIAAKESKKATEKLLKELGIDDVKSAKEGLNRLKEWQESQKTEEQKRLEELESYKTKATEAEQTISNLTAKLEALKLGVKSESVDDVITLARNYVSNEKDISQSIKEVIEKYPHFSETVEEAAKPKFINPKNNVNESSKVDLVDKLLEKYKKR